MWYVAFKDEHNQYKILGQGKLRSLAIENATFNAASVGIDHMNSEKKIEALAKKGEIFIRSDSKDETVNPKNSRERKEHDLKRKTDS